MEEDQLLEEGAAAGPIAMQLSALQSNETEQEVRDWLDSIEMRSRLAVDPLLVGILSLPLWSLLRMLYLMRTFRWYSWDWLISVLLATAVPAAINYRVSRTRCEAQEDRLADAADTSWIGPLTLELDTSNTHRRAGAKRLLTRLLTRVRHSDTGLLDATQQGELIYTLRRNRPKDMDLNVAIIRALEHIGDDAAVSAIEYVAESNLWRPSQGYVQKVAVASLRRIANGPVERPSVRGALTLANTAQSASWMGQRQAVPEVDALKNRLKKAQDGRGAPGLRRPFLTAAWLTLLPGTLWLAMDSLSGHNRYAALAYLGCFGLVTQLPRFVLSHEQQEAARRLAEFDNVQGVGPLAEALEWPDPAIRVMAAKSLIRLLPLLNASDTALLTASQRGCLHRKLKIANARKQESLLSSILKAMEQVGDESAVPYVRQLADAPAKSRAQQRIKVRAKECLPYLIAGASQRQGSQMLLRASSIDSTQPDILLRSASESCAIESVQLLRAGKDGE